jgi:hypothetical protein
LLTDDAVRDLEDLTDYIDRHDVPGKSDGLRNNCANYAIFRASLVARLRKLRRNCAIHSETAPVNVIDYPFT